MRRSTHVKFEFSTNLQSVVAWFQSVCLQTVFRGILEDTVYRFWILKNVIRKSGKGGKMVESLLKSSWTELLKKCYRS